MGVSEWNIAVSLIYRQSWWPLEGMCSLPLPPAPSPRPSLPTLYSEFLGALQGKNLAGGDNHLILLLMA